MLPDTVHKLPREERFAYARLLAFMARIDNELTVDEMAMFEHRHLNNCLCDRGFSKKFQKNAFF